MEKKSKLLRLLIGLLLTLVVFCASVILGRKFIIHSEFLASSFMTHALMLVLSIGLIILMRNHVNYRIAMPQARLLLKPILYGFLSAVIINLVMTMLIFAVGGSLEKHPALDNSTALQFFFFVFILASVAEEFLFRGFLQNYLKPLRSTGFTLLGKRISLPVIVGALAFGMAHLVLIFSGVGTMFIIKTLVFTIFLGLIAGYYQEKYDNHVYAIIVHMSGNLMGLIALMMSNMIHG